MTEPSPRERRETRHAFDPKVRRPGAVGGVTVRAPLLDPTRSAAAPVARSRSDRTSPSSLARRPAAERKAHPRLVDRQRAIRRAERIATLRPLVLPAAVVAVLAGLAFIVLFSPLFAVRSVILRFDGSPAEQTELARIVGPLRNQNIIRLDAGGRESALRSLSWVATASVRRSFPGTIEVRVTSHDIAGAVRLPNGQAAMVATDGRVLDVVAAADPSISSLPMFDLGLTATAAPDDALAAPAPAILSSATAFNRRLPGRLQRVTVRDNQVEWTLRRSGDSAAVRVLVGRPKDSDVPAAALASILSRPGRLPTLIDLRTPATPVLTFANKP